jgi:alpha-galactosidase
MDWFGEGQWSTRTLEQRGIVDLALGPGRGMPDPRGRIATISSSTWSTGTSSPTAVLNSVGTGRALAWQIEHNGPWRWEVGEAGGTAYVALSGPTFGDHGWFARLEPGESFRTVPASVAVRDGGLDGAFAELTRARRAVRRITRTPREAPLVYNDYMNTLGGDPSLDRVLPLLDAAARLGVEYYCVDAGWYDVPGSSWWDRVGEWRVDLERFPGGLERLKAEADARGVGLGVWIEPEVIGVRSPLAQSLPEEAFLRRNGERVVAQGRYHLDFSSAAARAHVDAVMDHLAGEVGISYVKFDYNITPGLGGEGAGGSVGAGLLAHSRAYVAWLADLGRRHPRLLIENCASGGMRMDYAVLGVADIQSTSDQQDLRHYAPIAALAPASVLPEQAGNWAYPQPAMSDDEIIMTMVNGLAGVPYLSGFVDGLSDAQAELVAGALRLFAEHRAELATGLPSWPVGLEQGRTGWNCLRVGRLLYLWRHADADAALRVPLVARATRLYPPPGRGAEWVVRGNGVRDRR